VAKASKAVFTQARKHYMFVAIASGGRFEKIGEFLLKSSEIARPTLRVCTHIKKGTSISLALSR
jgi:hypothetical protein